MVVKVAVACFFFFAAVDAFTSPGAALDRKKLVRRTKPEDGEDFESAFEARVAELGGARGVRARSAAAKVQRGVGESGETLKKFLDLETPKGAKKGSAKEELQLLSAGGWASTVALLGLVVFLAVLQAFRIDPSNYT